MIFSSTRKQQIRSIARKRLALCVDAAVIGGKWKGRVVHLFCTVVLYK
jgi:hypothetical protein